jgi:hypothetical protein
MTDELFAHSETVPSDLLSLSPFSDSCDQFVTKINAIVSARNQPIRNFSQLKLIGAGGHCYNGRTPVHEFRLLKAAPIHHSQASGQAPCHQEHFLNLLPPKPTRRSSIPGSRMSDRGE